MTAETDLLPPEPFAWVNQYEAEDYIDGVDHHFTALRRGVPGDDFPIYSAGQVRACASSATAPLQAEIETLLAELDIRDSIIATHAADTREYQKRISQAEARAERLAEALRNSADALERLAFAIRAPNAHTPQLVELAIAMRAAALRSQEEVHEHLP